MSSTLVMNGLENLEGRQFGTLRVTRMVRRNPEPSYSTVCEKCSAESTATHTRLRNGAAVCLNSSCGKVAKPTGRELLREQKRIAAEREAEAERAALASSAARMEADSDGWERPERYTPTPEPRVMTQRERDSLREFREAEEAAERERRRPIEEAERATAERVEALVAEQETALRQLHSIERERIATGRDDTFEIDPATVGEANAIPADRVGAWQAAQFTEFLAENASYYKCDENGAAIAEFIERNAPGLKLLSASQLTAAYKRLNSFGLLKERPASAPKLTPMQAERVAEPPKPTGPKETEVETGWNWMTGEPLTLTAKQVASLSADEYRRFKKLDKAALELPTAPSGRYAT